MKTISFLLVTLGVMQMRPYFPDKTADSLLSDITEKRNSLKMPDVNDVFFILTSDTVSGGLEGIYREVRIGQTVFIGDSTYIIDEIGYELKSESRKMYDCGFTYSHTDELNAPEHLRQRRLFLPKAFLEKIEPVDLGTDFP